MNKVCRWIITLAPVFCALMASAQEANDVKVKKEKTVKLYGEVYDSFTKAKVRAKITVMTADSTVIREDSTRFYGMDSDFNITVPKRDGKYIFKLESDDYETTFYDYELKTSGRKQWYDVPRILMKRKANDIFKDVELGGVVVKGTKIQVAYKGDTIVYDASAFNLPEGSMLDALVRQLPGAELKDNGDIYINGEKIDYLTLNGSDFFKGDNKVMLENMPYFTVKNVQVYHKSTERSEALGREIDEKEFVMDVKLKREYSRGYILNAEAGAGTEDRYMSRAFGLYYDDHTRVSLFGNVNNVNEVRQPGNDGDWTPSNMSKSVLEHKQTGFDLQTEDKDKRVKERFSTSFTWDDEDAVTRKNAETFSSGGNINEQNNNVLNDKQFSFYANNSLSFPKINLYTYMSLNCRSGKFNSETDNTTTRGGEPVNSRRTLSYGENEYISFAPQLAWAKPLKSGDAFFANFYGDFFSNKPVDRFNKEHTTYAVTGETETTNKYTDRRSNNYRYNINGGYIYSLPDFWNLQASVLYEQKRETRYDYLYRLDRLDDEIYDQFGTIPVSEDDYMVAFDRENSEKSTVLSRRYEAELALYKNTKDYNIRLGLPLTHIREKMNYTQSALDTLAKRSVTKFHPTLRFRRFGSTPLTLTYSLYVDQPAFKDLMPVTNAADNLSLYINNPDLANIITHRGSGQITFKNSKTGGSAYVGFDAMVKQHDIGTRVTYNSVTGAYTYKDDNVDGKWSGSVKGGLDCPLDKAKRLRLGVNGSVKYERNVDFAVAYDEAGDALSKVDNIYTRLNTKLTYRFKTLSAGIVAKFTYRHGTGNLDNFVTIDVYDYQYGGNLQYTIPLLKLNVSTDLNMFSRRGYASSMMNTDDLIWNAQVSRTFLKGRITAKITAFDLLHNLSNVRYSMSAQGRTETWYNSIPRYVMLSLAYTFKQKPNKNK